MRSKVEFRVSIASITWLKWRPQRRIHNRAKDCSRIFGSYPRAVRVNRHGFTCLSADLCAVCGRGYWAFSPSAGNQTEHDSRLDSQ